jgi:NADPH:quinone reductase-like Zn-dependent oxidoreductase
MHAWQFDHYGHYSENLHWVERPTPKPGFGEALVRTRAVSLNLISIGADQNFNRVAYDKQPCKHQQGGD